MNIFSRRFISILAINLCIHAEVAVSQPESNARNENLYETTIPEDLKAEKRPWYSFGTSNTGVVDDIIACSEKIVYYGHGNRDGLDFAAKILDLTVKNAGDQTTAKFLQKRCVEVLAETQRDPVEREAALGYIDSLDIADGVKRLVAGFLKPYVKCSVAGINLNAAVGLALGVKGDIAMCTDSFSRRWIEVRPSVGLGMGVGAHLGVYAGSKNRGYSHFPISLSTSTETTLGLGINWQGQGDSMFSGKRVGVGLGAAWTIVKSGELNIYAMPWTSNKRYLRSILYSIEKG